MHRRAPQGKKKEIKEYKAMKKGVKKELKDDPDNPNLWNKLHLVLWILGDFAEASKAFQKARKLGWDSESSKLVSL